VSGQRIHYCSYNIIVVPAVTNVHPNRECVCFRCTNDSTEPYTVSIHPSIPSSSTLVNAICFGRMMKVLTQKTILGVLEFLSNPDMCSGSKKKCKNERTLGRGEVQNKFHRMILSNLLDHHPSIHPDPLVGLPKMNLTYHCG
jgi:hypothetical protein